MALSTFFELKKEVIDYSHRGDLDLKIPDFILLAEKEMFNNDIEILSPRYLEITVDIPTVTTSNLVALPSDYKSLRNTRVNITDEIDFLEYRTPEQLKQFDTTGRPCFFTIVGGNMQLDRTPDDIFNIELQYAATVTPLNATNTTNLVLTNNPEIYLYGTLYKAFTFAQDTEQALSYKSLFYQSIAGANRFARSGRYGPSPVMKVDGPTP